MRVLVLLSSYNGEKFICEQIDSILNQRLDESIKIELLVRDDGSSDSTKNILNKYMSESKLTWYDGENLRPAKSFWNLVNKAPDADFYAFCDQDDKWFDDKIARAIELLTEADGPALYCSAVTATDADLNPLDGQTSNKTNTTFANSLMYSLAPGCTFVFNKAAREQLLRYDMDKETELIHDWLAHKIIALKGQVIYDSRPSMYYRQHGNNVIGSQSGISGFINRVKRYLADKTNIRSKVAKSLVNVYGADEDLDSENRRYLNIVANYKTNKDLKKAFLKEKAFKTNTVNDIFANLLIRMGMI